MAQKDKNPPIQTHRDGAISAKVWRNYSNEGEPFYSVTFQRTYTDPKTKEPRETNSFLGTDVLKVQQLAAEAYRTIGHERQLDKDYAKSQEAGRDATGQGKSSPEQQRLSQERDAAFERSAPEQQRSHGRTRGHEPSMS